MSWITGIPSRRTPPLVLALTIALLLAPLGAAPRASAGEDRETAVGEESAAITATLPAGDYTWQATTLPAEPAPAVSVPFHLGFVAAIADPVTVIDAAGLATELVPGLAVAVDEGEALAVEAPGDAPADFSAIELVPIEDAEDPDAIAFPLTDGTFSLKLQRYTPPAGDAIAFSQLTQPILVVVQAGSFTVTGGTPGAEPGATLVPGDATTLLFDTQLEQVGTDPTAFYIVGLEPSDEQPSVAPSIEPSASSLEEPSRQPSAREQPSRRPLPSSEPSTETASPSPSSAPSRTPKG